MARLKAGDRVSCRLKENCVVSQYADFEDIKTFEIIAKDDSGYFVYVPAYIHVRGTIKIDNYNSKRLEILPKFIGEEALYISDNQVNKVEYILDGLNCEKCQEYYEYASYDADLKFVCFSCRQNPYR